jgi:ankyrin repeat protein
MHYLLLLLLNVSFCSNFLRRGGSPNTARQNASPNDSVREGFGLIHAAIQQQNASVLDLLLQHGANPNASTLSTAEEDKVTAGYLAASVGWAEGLHMLAQARADLVNSRGFGNRQRTTLHGAVEKNHLQAAQVVTMYTEGVLTNIPDANGTDLN